MWEWYNTGTTCTSSTTAGNSVYYSVCSSTTATTCTQATNHIRLQRYINTYNTGYSHYEDPRVWLEGQRRIQARQLEKHPEEARERAIGLLLENLSPEQRETFQKNKWFIVEGGKSGLKYRIHANDNVAANIDVLDGDKIARRLCGHCEVAKVPLGDHLLAQKIMLENAEEDFLRIANRHAA